MITFCISLPRHKQELSPIASRQVLRTKGIMLLFISMKFQRIFKSHRFMTSISNLAIIQSEFENAENFSTNALGT